MNIALAAAGLHSAYGYLADGGDSPSDVDPSTGHGPEWGEAAPIGLLVVVLMCVAVYFLVKSLNRNLKKVPEAFDPVPVSVGRTLKVPADPPSDSAGSDPTPPVDLRSPGSDE